MQSRHNRALDAVKWLANLGESHEEWVEFLKKHPHYLNWQESLLGFRDQVRKLWRGGEMANEIARRLLLEEEVHHGPEGEKPLAFSPARVNVDWDRGELVLDYKALNVFHASIYELLRVSRFAKVCARRGCPAPYFIAEKITQQYCSDDCKYEARKAVQNAYWERRGSRVRRERKQRSKAKKRR